MQRRHAKKANTILLTGKDPNSIKIWIPITLLTCSSQTNQRADNDMSEPTLTSHQGPAITLMIDEPGVSTHSANATKLTIQIPALPTIFNSNLVDEEDEPDPNEGITTGQYTFCLIEHCNTVVEMMEQHFCTHPLIPGYSTPTPKGIKAWAVKQSYHFYEFCILHNLPNLWAYL
jgi:hypothetical protein